MFGKNKKTKEELEVVAEVKEEVISEISEDTLNDLEKSTCLLTNYNVPEKILEVVVPSEEPVVEEKVGEKYDDEDKIDDISDEPEEELQAEPEVVEETPQYKTFQELNPKEYRFYLNTGKLPLK